MEELIKKVVNEFYDKAIKDPFLAYHFAKIASFKTADPTKAPLKAFKDHLPRIIHFWEVQLLQTPLDPSVEKFNLLEVHRALNIKKGELGRWLTLFNEVLKNNETSECSDFIKAWQKKLRVFEKRFIDHLF